MSNKKNIYLDSFLHTLKILVKEASAYIPDDPNIYRANKRCMLAIQMEPLLTFNKVGSYLYKYRDYIYDSSTENLLLKLDFSEEVKNSEEYADICKLIIEELKRCLSKMDDDKKTYYRKMVCSLLDDYLEYNCA